MQLNSDVVAGVQVTHQVFGHLGHGRSANQDGDLGGESAETERGLPGGVGASDDIHILIGHSWRLGHARAVEDTPANQRLEAVDADAPITDAGRQHDRPAAYLRTVVEHEQVSVGLRTKVSRGSTDEEPCAEDPCL